MATVVDDVSQDEVAWEVLEKSEFMSTSHQSSHSFLYMLGVVLLLFPMSKRPYLLLMLLILVLILPFIICKCLERCLTCLHSYVLISFFDLRLVNSVTWLVHKQLHLTFISLVGYITQLYKMFARFVILCYHSVTKS